MCSRCVVEARRRGPSASPAARGGLRSGDIIVEVDGHPIADVADLQRLMVGDAPDGPVHVLVWRDGDTRTLVVEPAELEAA